MITSLGTGLMDGGFCGVEYGSMLKKSRDSTGLHCIGLNRFEFGSDRIKWYLDPTGRVNSQNQSLSTNA